VYEGIETMTKKIERWAVRKEGDGKLLIGGDFNARVGGEGGGFDGEEGESRERKAKDRIINGERKN